jgi:hypothetical protein
MHNYNNVKLWGLSNNNKEISFKNNFLISLHLKKNLKSNEKQCNEQALVAIVTVDYWIDPVLLGGKTGSRS